MCKTGYNLSYYTGTPTLIDVLYYAHCEKYGTAAKYQVPTPVNFPQAHQATATQLSRNGKYNDA